VNGLFNVATLNVLWRMMAGSQYSRNDKELLIILEKVNRMFRAGNPSGSLINIFPILKTIAPGLSGHKEKISRISDLQDYFRVSNVIQNFYNTQNHSVEIFGNVSIFRNAVLSSYSKTYSNWNREGRNIFSTLANFPHYRK
jgi:hypothetical protein